MFAKKIHRSDMIRCVLCADAPCSKACVRPGEVHIKKNKQR